MTSAPEQLDDLLERALHYVRFPGGEQVPAVNTPIHGSAIANAVLDQNHGTISPVVTYYWSGRRRKWVCYCWGAGALKLAAAYGGEGDEDAASFAMIFAPEAIR